MTIKTIKTTIEQYYNVDLSQRNRHAVNVEAKQMYAYFTRLLTYYSYQRIAEEIGYNHANIMHHEQKAKDFKHIDKDFLNRLNEINTMLENNPNKETQEDKINYQRLYNAQLFENKRLMRKYQNLLKSTRNLRRKQKSVVI